MERTPYGASPFPQAKTDSLDERRIPKGYKDGSHYTLPRRELDLPEL